MPIEMAVSFFRARRYVLTYIAGELPSKSTERRG